MLLELSHMREARARIERAIEPSHFPAADADAYQVEALVELAFDLYKDGRQFHLVGDLTTRLGLSCSRCLEDFSLPVKADFDLLYVPHVENTGEGEREVEDDDLTTAYYRDEQIDLTQLVREQLYLALPMKPLCRDDCRGLCAECGTNLNTGACRCERTWTDPRLDSLRSLVDKSGGTGGGTV